MLVELEPLPPQATTKAPMAAASNNPLILNMDSSLRCQIGLGNYRVPAPRITDFAPFGSQLGRWRHLSSVGVTALSCDEESSPTATSSASAPVPTGALPVQGSFRYRPEIVGYTTGTSEDLLELFWREQRERP